MSDKPAPNSDLARHAMMALSDPQRLALMIEIMSQIEDPACIQQLDRCAKTAHQVADQLRHGSLSAASMKVRNSNT